MADLLPEELLPQGEPLVSVRVMCACLLCLHGLRCSVMFPVLFVSAEDVVDEEKQRWIPRLCAVMMTIMMIMKIIPQHRGR